METLILWVFWKTLMWIISMTCDIIPDALFNGVSFVVLEISVQFLQFEQSLFPGGLGPGWVQRRRNSPTFRYCIRHTLHLPIGTTLINKLELPCVRWMPLPTSQVEVYIYVCLDSYNICTTPTSKKHNKIKMQSFPDELFTDYSFTKCSWAQVVISFI